MAEVTSEWNRPASEDTAAAGSGVVTITTVSTPIVAANPQRTKLILTHNSSGVTYLGLGAAAVLNQGIRISGTAGVNSHVIDYFTGAVNGICASATRTVTYVEI